MVRQKQMIVATPKKVARKDPPPAATKAKRARRPLLNPPTNGQGLSRTARNLAASMLKLITPRWKPLRFHQVQHALVNACSRFRLVPAGRRSGKTELAKRYLVIKALQGTAFDDARFFAAAPTRDQAKDIFWEDLKALTPKWAIARISESRLFIELINGSAIYVVGMDKPARIEGRPWDGGVLDEYGNTKAGAWMDNIRPALMDRKGWCWLIGTPEGRNHYYDLVVKARKDKTGEWEVFTWSSEDIVDADEIAAMKAGMDEESYEREVNANFTNFKGRCYRQFNAETHAATPLEWNPRAPLVFAFDFNVDPGVAVVMQEMTLPNGLQGTGIIGEVYIEGDSDTIKVCNKLIEDWTGQEGPVFLYGDRTGGNRGSAKVQGSDWKLVKGALREHFNIIDKVGRSPNPPVRDRINAVNGRIKAKDGAIRLMVDPSCEHVIKDFDGVLWLKGAAGEIDKRDHKLTHLTDSLGYYIHERWPVTYQALVERAKIVIG